jgi:cytochrome b
MAEAAHDGRTVKVWDLPTRLFHWVLSVLVLMMFLTGELDWPAIPLPGRTIDHMIVHKWCGYAILALLLFRLAWGMVGSSTARFASFVRGPGAAFTYLGGLFRKPAAFFAGHNPAGGLMIVLMLAALLVQAITGLFSKDDDDFLGIAEGPLHRSVSEATGKTMTNIHLYGHEVIEILIYVHILANLYYWLVRREDLIAAMFTGRRRLPTDVTAQDATFVSANLALGLIFIAAFIVWGAIALLCH